MIDFFAQKCNANTFKTTVNNYLTLKICDKILQSIARRFDVSRTSLPSEYKIIKLSIYSEEMNELKMALKVTVPLKSKLTVPRASILEPRDSILDPL